MRIPFARTLGPIAAALLFAVPGPRDTAAATPQPQTARGSAIVSGGIGEEERELMRREAAPYNLWLVFVEQGSGNYLAGVKVVIADANGSPVVDAVAEGPWLFARVPPGRYKVRTPDGREQWVTAGSSGRAMSVLRLAPATGSLP
jgi:hypothetical protein